MITWNPPANPEWSSSFKALAFIASPLPHECHLRSCVRRSQGLGCGRCWWWGWGTRDNRQKQTRKPVLINKPHQPLGMPAPISGNRLFLVPHKLENGKNRNRIPVQLGGPSVWVACGRVSDDEFTFGSLRGQVAKGTGFKCESPTRKCCGSGGVTRPAARGGH